MTRIFPASVFVILLCLPGPALRAAEADGFTGMPAVLPSGMVMVQGHDLTLWGIAELASDQQCWHENRAWDCGEQSLIALRHYLAGHPVRCAIKSYPDNGPMSAQCFRKSGNKEEDIAQYLVAQGWARDAADESDNLYAKDEDSARQSRRGIWTSRFQRAKDWKNGISRYVEYEAAPPRVHAMSAMHMVPASDDDAR